MIKVGLDIGSTTVKAAVLDENNKILWKRYERHHTRQLEKVNEFIKTINKEFRCSGVKLFTTGSGGKRTAQILNVKHYQEVNALSAAVEHLHTDAGSVFELGGQDAKYIAWRTNSGKFVSMNDRCAGGTGATIDRIIKKLNLSEAGLQDISYCSSKRYPVAGKCGVFAETDINSLQKQGIPVDALLVSLFQAVVEQNLAVLARGYTPTPPVLLLGGPNVFFKALRESWRARLFSLWDEQGIAYNRSYEPDFLDERASKQGAAHNSHYKPNISYERTFKHGISSHKVTEQTLRSDVKDSDVKSRTADIFVPENALYYGAFGAALLGTLDKGTASYIDDFNILSRYLDERKKLQHRHNNDPFFKNETEKERFIKTYAQKKPTLHYHGYGNEVNVFIGIDGGSTSTKGVLLDKNERVIWTAYKISGSDPVEDARQILQVLMEGFEKRGVHLDVQGIGFTGYAKDLLHAVFGGDMAIVETVAHTLGALKYFPDAEVICDVGGQDIKIIILKNGSIKDFRLNTQCSAGNGYYLQSTAERLGYTIDDFAETAFMAKHIPSFNFGCAVFLEADIVNFQQLGWRPEEIMAGLAKVLPQNVWHYVVREPNLERLGRVFILQGGTHKNLAVVKAQYDFIKSRVKGAKIYVHPFNEVAGAIGAALAVKNALSLQYRQAYSRTFSSLSAASRKISSSLQRVRILSPFTEGSRKGSPPHAADPTSFIGFDALSKVHYTVERNEKTRCSYCKNSCMRTFITVYNGNHKKKYIIAGCDKGQAENREDLRKIMEEMKKTEESAPHFIHISNQRVFSSFSPPVVAAVTGRKRKHQSLMKAVIGIPRVLNMYATAPLFSTYFESLGVAKVCFSDFTSETLYRKTAGRGSIDPCFPSKVAVSHVYQLLHTHAVTHIFFPCIRMVRGEIHNDEHHWACAALSATPEAVKAAFTLEKNEFLARGIQYLDPVLDIGECDVFERQLYRALKPIFGITRKENKRAIKIAVKVWDNYLSGLRQRAEQVLLNIEESGAIGIVLLGRPYHNDPGIHHGILDELNKRGYPIFTIESLPRSGKIVRRIFAQELVQKKMHQLDIRDTWLKCYSENSAMKVWAAKFTARHPNLVALDLSSFRCGHDAPIYSVVDEIFSRYRSPYFTFHEIDENKPASSIKLRVETIDYFLTRYREELSQCRNYSLVV